MARRPAGEVLGRRQEIIRHLRENTYMSVGSLSEVMGVSEVTIRRDLDALDADGVLERKRGGAFISAGADRTENESEQSSRSGAIARIAEAAVGRIEPEDVVLLSGGPISEEIGRLLNETQDLVVITNSVRVFEILEENRGIHLISTGGELRHSNGALVGPMAEASIQNIRADRFILEPSGISEANGLFCSSLPDVPVLRAMIHAARDVVVVAESAAFDREGIMQVASTSVATEMITDELNESIVGRLENEGITIVTT